MDLNYAPEDREFRATTRRWLAASRSPESVNAVGIME